MPQASIGFGVVLIAIGLFGYLSSAKENPSLTALIPALVGVLLALCGVLAFRPNLRMHAMHAAAMIALLGAIAAFGRFAMKFSYFFSDDLTLARPVRLSFLMGLVCLIHVIVCVRSFIAARRRRMQATGD